MQNIKSINNRSWFNFLGVTGLLGTIPYATNEIAQDIRKATGENIYHALLNPETSNFLLNHGSSFSGAMAEISFLSGLSIIKHGKSGETGMLSKIFNNVEKNSAIAAALNTAYEFAQASGKVQNVDYTDLGMAYAACLLFYTAFSNSMPWNKSKKLSRDRALELEAPS